MYSNNKISSNFSEYGNTGVSHCGVFVPITEEEKENLFKQPDQQLQRQEHQQNDFYFIFILPDFPEIEAAAVVRLKLDGKT